MLVTVGSKNKVKVNAVMEALKLMGIDAEVIEVEVDSGVPLQPYCNDTFVGARNRAIRSIELASGDIGIGIEGGVCIRQGMVMAFAVVHCVSKEGRENLATSSYFTLPEEVSSLMIQGKELGEATDIVFHDKESKRGLGAVGHITKGLISRTALYVQPVILALYPFLG
jgi:inosine/xanthosine triphosphatase